MGPTKVYAGEVQLDSLPAELRDLLAPRRRHVVPQSPEDVAATQAAFEALVAAAADPDTPVNSLFALTSYMGQWAIEMYGGENIDAHELPAIVALAAAHGIDVWQPDREQTLRQVGRKPLLVFGLPSLGASAEPIEDEAAVGDTRVPAEIAVLH